MKRSSSFKDRHRAGTAAGVRIRTPRTKRAGLVLLVAILALTVYVYWPVRGYDFVSVDDSVYVTENPFLRGGLTWTAVAGALTSTYAHFWHPLTLLSLMLDAAVFGKAPGPFHVTNLLLHLGSTLLLFLALARMTGAAGRSAFVTALFALHPLHVESVAWIAERKDVLSTFFWMLTMWAWAGYAKKGRRGAYWLALASFALGLAAKPMLVTLPVTLLLLDVWPFGRLSVRGFAAGAGSAGAVRGWLPLVREKIPFFLLAVASGGAAVFAQGAAVASLEAIPIGTRVANALAVTSDNYYAQHGMGSLLREQGRASEAVPYLRESIRLNPRFPDSHNNLGMALESLGRFDEAASEYAEALRIDPEMALAHNNLGGLRLRAGQADEAESQFLEALRQSPGLAAVHDNLGQARAAHGRFAEAQAEYLEALRLQSDFAAAHAHLGYALANQGKMTEAVAEYRESLRLAPDVADTHNDLGIALGALGRIGEAIVEFEQSIRLDPGDALAHVNLGFAFAGQGRPAEAIPHFTEAIRLQPNLELAHLYLGWALGGTGKLAEAMAEFREVLRINPNNENARRALDTLSRRAPRPLR